MSLLAFGLAACAVDGPAPLVVARGGGAAYWPPDSRTAIEGALALELDAIEVGVVLTADDVPVLAHRLALDASWCTHEDGAPLGPEVDIGELPFEALAQGYLCGGVPDPRYEQALVVAEPLLPLDALLERLHEAPGDLELRIFVVQAPGRARPPAAYAQAVLDRWVAEDLPQALVVSSHRPEVLAAFDARGRALGFDARRELVLARDPFATGIDRGYTDLEAQRLTGQLDYARLAADAGADGVAIDAVIADPLLLRAARDAGVAVTVRDVDDPGALRHWTRPGRADAVVTDWPGDVP